MQVIEGLRINTHSKYTSPSKFVGDLVSLELMTRHLPADERSSDNPTFAAHSEVSNDLVPVLVEDNAPFGERVLELLLEVGEGWPGNLAAKLGDDRFDRASFLRHRNGLHQLVGLALDGEINDDSVYILREGLEALLEREAATPQEVQQIGALAVMYLPVDVHALNLSHRWMVTFDLTETARQMNSLIAQRH